MGRLTTSLRSLYSRVNSPSARSPSRALQPSMPSLKVSRPSPASSACSSAYRWVCAASSAKRCSAGACPGPGSGPCPRAYRPPRRVKPQSACWPGRTRCSKPPRTLTRVPPCGATGGPRLARPRSVPMVHPQPALASSAPTPRASPNAIAFLYGMFLVSCFTVGIVFTFYAGTRGSPGIALIVGALFAGGAVVGQVWGFTIQEQNEASLRSSSDMHTRVICALALGLPARTGRS